MRTRRNIATLGGPWSSEILWYARAVQALKQRKAYDPTSWAYLAAIHGIDPPGWVAGGAIGSLAELPTKSVQDADFNQCQHAGWFFLPWHRGYLAAFENILADWIAAQPQGPADWALPYWNYLDAADPNARAIPPEFLSANWPDGAHNPLLAPRGGTAVLGPQPWLGRADISLAAQTKQEPYTAAPGTQGYGGAISGFSSEGDLAGAVELNPHNTVHVMIGGVGATAGWMSDPAYAALDPVFWVHHCNIDRLWAAWMKYSGNVQETGSPWSNGPFPRQFAMPDPNGARVVFVPGETLPGAPLEPTYDDLYKGAGFAPAAGGVGMAVASASGGGRTRGPGGSGPGGGGGTGGGSTLVGANDAQLVVGAAPARTSVALDARPTAGLAAASAAPARERYYLNIEGVRGDAASVALDVALRPVGAAQARHLDTVTLFGLARASSTQGRHAGNGLSVAIEITDEVRGLPAGGPIGPESLDVEISQPGNVSTPITIDRVSIYKTS